MAIFCSIMMVMKIVHFVKYISSSQEIAGELYLPRI